MVFGNGIASTVARTARMGYSGILRKTLCCPLHPSPRHGHTTPFTRVSSIPTVGRAEPFGLVLTPVMPCGEKGAMDRHRIRLCARTSSQDVPVRGGSLGAAHPIERNLARAHRKFDSGFPFLSRRCTLIMFRSGFPDERTYRQTSFFSRVISKTPAPLGELSAR